MLILAHINCNARLISGLGLISLIYQIFDIYNKQILELVAEHMLKIMLSIFVTLL